MKNIRAVKRLTAAIATISVFRDWKNFLAIPVKS
jgi:hypothetical protein